MQPLDSSNIQVKSYTLNLIVLCFLTQELLVLEEKMGTVSTALSEEELSKCIKISVYESLQLEDEGMMCSLGADESKCSICQVSIILFFTKYDIFGFCASLKIRPNYKLGFVLFLVVTEGGSFGLFFVIFYSLTGQLGEKKKSSIKWKVSKGSNIPKNVFKIQRLE